MSPPAERALTSRWLCEPLPDDVARALERLENTDDVRRIAVLPDVHLAQDVCIGTVIATKTRIYPQAVGSDIGCGMAALPFDAPAAILDDEKAAARLLSNLYMFVPAIRHSRETMRESLPSSLQDAPLSHPSLERLKARDARVEFATLGRGNHFLEFQRDDAGTLWLMLHSGSRALGQAIKDHHLESAKRANTGLLFFEAEEAAGQAYLADMVWALEFADQSRRAMVDMVATLIKQLFDIAAIESGYFSCHHNHVARESHFGADLWVHRKGAIPAHTDVRGIIPGSMGSASYHVTGRGVGESLCSSSHGAGRRGSRADARKAISLGSLERQMKGIWFDHRIADKLRDEAPEAYKDITRVMRAQSELTRVERRLTPVLSYKGA